MKPVVFVGPTVDVRTALALLKAEYRSPARQGDILRSVLDGVPAIGLIDGYFERVPSVWHKEILVALARGTHVYGSSSMGALRASELHSFGMRGVGKVFQSYQEGRIEDDDEVAIQHAPPELGYAPLSEAMVNIRATLTAALEAKVIGAALAASLTRIAKQTHYKNRSYENLIRHGRENGLSIDCLSRFESWLGNGKVDQKRLDALELLKEMAKDQKRDFRVRSLPPVVVERSLSCQTLLESLGKRN
ncbi:TfuA-like protein [Mesorhizobium ventifaucium]|uniref:TfuA-like core domain-containing protein n=1 Tax=Mesorhizobium ventifaucium TaxID=666020 RepID=A0ABM9E782_9HYPH|nr:TfuA-like protein [Mesorhizobium ventifaucium]CAH2404999.1 hypothetical protein MES4922_40012 [Mesorhizobium ventifaucium]